MDSQLKCNFYDLLKLKNIYLSKIHLFCILHAIFYDLLKLVSISLLKKSPFLYFTIHSYNDSPTKNLNLL